jgi:hypothetical protein
MRGEPNIVLLILGVENTHRNIAADGKPTAQMILLSDGAPIVKISRDAPGPARIRMKLPKGFIPDNPFGYPRRMVPSYEVIYDTFSRIDAPTDGFVSTSR